MSSSDLSPEL
jgi:hypothetical protein